MWDARKQEKSVHQGMDGLTSNNFGTLEVLVRVKVARRQGKPEPDEEEKQVSTAPHVEVAFFLLRPAQALAGAWP